MNVHFDTWFSERSLVDAGAIETTLDDSGPTASSTTPTARWLRSTDFGDDKDRGPDQERRRVHLPAPDIAYHRDKLARHSTCSSTWGADHHGYIARMKAAMQALGHDPDELEVSIVQLVALMKGGEPVKLSKRAGDIVELADVLDEVGPDAARLTYLLQSVDSPQTFDIDVVTSEGNDNPVFYVQMAYSRIRSIKRVAVDRAVTRLPVADVASLLARARARGARCCRLPEVVAPRPPIGPRTGSPRGSGSWPVLSTASTTTATCW
jgi:arginyl-tRNA synthetase